MHAYFTTQADRVNTHCQFNTYMHRVCSISYAWCALRNYQTANDKEKKPQMNIISTQCVLYELLTVYYT